MALMVPIDEDLATLLETEAQRTGESVAARTNRVLRAELSQAAAKSPVVATEPVYHAVTPVERPRFKVRPFDLSLPAEWTSGCIEELLDIVEGPDHR